MNNNRNQNNNRRRGRGNRNQSGSGGNQGNRIDSRARGNAPQLLDKYKKLAEDAHRNGDRVQAEYYLQFADHYFRVIADNRSRQDEQRGGRRDERDQDEFESDDAGEFGAAGEFGGSDDRRRFEPRERPERNERPDRDGTREGRDRDYRETREPREARKDRPRRDIRRGDEGNDGSIQNSDGAPVDADENPFLRDTREERPRRRAPRAARSGETDTGIDAAALPPPFSLGEGDGVADDRDGSGETAAPRARRKRSDGGTLSAVG